MIHVEFIVYLHYKFPWLLLKKLGREVDTMLSGAMCSALGIPRFLGVGPGHIPSQA